jgi:hypothetical protein
MNRVTLLAAIAGTMLLGMGCSATAGDEAAPAPQEFGISDQALGSTKGRVDISTWNGLTTMVSDGNYRLTADINASGKTWTPQDFTGTFDGGGKTISNLTINVTGDAGFFRYLSEAIVTNVKFTNLKVTGTWMVGGLASVAQDSQVDRVAIEGTLTATQGFAVGGVFGEMLGGSLFRSYAKGTAKSALLYAGGIAGFAAGGLSRATITESYAQVTVAPDTSDVNRTVNAGGIVGRAAGGVDVHDVYAVGDVTGRNGVGGIVGVLDCQNDEVWLVYQAIYRGEVIDKNAPNGGWSGTLGTFGPCFARYGHLFFDRSLDQSSNWANASQVRGTTSELRSPTTVISGVYCLQPNNCANDNNFSSAVWDAGTNAQHHALLNMPGGLSAQPR